MPQRAKPSAVASPPAVFPSLLNSEDVARVLRLSLTTVRFYTGNTKHAEKLPPWFKLPGSNRLVWREEDVLKFIENSVRPDRLPVARRVGRPTKLEQIEMRSKRLPANEG